MKRRFASLAAVIVAVIVVVGVGSWVLGRPSPATTTSSLTTGPSSTQTAKVGLSTTSTSTLTSSSVTTSTKTTTVTSRQSSVASEAFVTILLGADSNTSSNGYHPANLVVVLGINNTVLWVNKDSVPHTISSSSSSQPFNSGNLDPGKTYAYTFTKLGTYQYYCSYHGWMYGTVTVTE